MVTYSVRTLTKVSLIVLSGLLGGCAKRVPLPASGETAPANKSGVLVITIDRKDVSDLVGQQVPEDKNQLISSRIHSEIIYPGDELEVVIYEKLPVSDEKRIERKRVNETGKIVIVPVGEVEIAGLSVIKAQKALEEKLQPYIVSPFCEIFISKKRYEPQIYIFGEANKTGVIPYTKGDRLIDAIAQAGGCREDAYRRSIKIIRANGPKITIFSVNFEDILKRGRLEENIALQDQDIIFVPRRFMTNFREITNNLSLIMPWYYFMRIFAPSVVP